MKGGKAKCSAYPSGEYWHGIPGHKIIIVDQRDKCDLFEEDEDWSIYDWYPDDTEPQSKE